MSFKKRAATICVAALLFFGYNGATAHAAPQAGFATGAQSAVVLEQTSRRALYEKNAHERVPMASTTKIMTALVALKYGSLDDLVKVGPNAAGVEGSSIYLKAGETWTLEDLLYGLMLQSGNDAAVAIAEHVGGSVPGFLDMMNAEAAELGAVDTHFATVNGLDKNGHYTTAYDLALIAAAAMDNADFQRIVSSKSAVIGDGEVRHSIRNKNKLLWQMDGANGIKTGYTRKAGRCFVGAAQREGMQLIAVVLNCGPMFEDSAALMDAAFARYNMVALGQAGQAIGVAKTVEGQNGAVPFGYAQTLSLPLEADEGNRVVLRVEVPAPLPAPVEPGQQAGRIVAYLDAKKIGEAQLVTLRGDLKRTWQWYVQRVAEGMLWKKGTSP